MLKRIYLKLLCILSIGVFLLIPEYINAYASLPESGIDIFFFYIILAFCLILAITTILSALRIRNRSN